MTSACSSHSGGNLNCKWETDQNLGVHASSEILYNLSPEYKTIDPCTDFEQLTCGGWDDRHDLRPDQGDAFTGTIMSENSQMLLRHILEASYPQKSKVSSTYQKFYSLAKTPI